MALTSTQLDYLRHTDQRFRCHVALFPAYVPTITAPVVGSVSGTGLGLKPLIRFSPRFSVVNNSGSIDIYVGNTYVRGGGAAGGTKNWSTDAGSLSASTGNTVTFTAPSSGSGVAKITVTCANDNGTSTSYAYVAYPKTAYDNIVAEIATIQGSLQQHGWKVTLRVRGAASDFAIGKGVLLHIEDTWGGTTSTFGGYLYPEGVVFGYITDLEYFEDGWGESWLAVEVQSPWWFLSRMKVGELTWGTQREGGKLYISNFTPVDAIWKFVQDITNFSQYHDVILWFDQNVIDDFITEESDLATLFDDIMQRTLSIAYCDRYGSLFCVPDPDVRADEFWGTPDSTYTLTPDFVMDYSITRQANQVRKLILAAFDSSKLGIYAASENPTAQGDVRTIRGLLCDNNLTLVGWAAEKRAQLNRAWEIEATHPLNHVLDLNNFVNAIFTAPAQAGAPTASGQAYADSITYRPDVFNGGWQGRIRYLKRITTADIDGVSGWGGTGSYWPGTVGYSGSSYFGSGTGGWTDPPQGNSVWCLLWDFTVGSGAWSIYDDGDWDTPPGSFVAGQGWSATRTFRFQDAGPGYTADAAWISAVFPSRVITQFDAWLTVRDTSYVAESWGVAVLDQETLVSLTNFTSVGAYQVTWTGVATATNIALEVLMEQAGGTKSGATIASARLKGSGTNPFGGGGTGNC